jgi:hypothetical protein
VKEQAGLTPLSVSADRIGSVAMRCAILLAELARRGRPVDELTTQTPWLKQGEIAGPCRRQHDAADALIAALAARAASRGLTLRPRNPAEEALAAPRAGSRSRGTGRR